MQEIRVSIVIPADECNLDWLMDSIQNALEQEYSNYEVIIASCSHDKKFADIISRSDSRVKRVTIRGSAENSTRITSLEAVTGDVIFFLLPGDRFHPNKIQEHMAFRNDHPEVILSYNSKFLVDLKNEIWYQATIPQTRNYIDFIYNLPIRLSDIVVKKDRILRINECDDGYGSAGGDTNFALRYISDGSIIAGINKPLNYQKQSINYYSIKPDGDEFIGLLEALDDYFYDQRCPREVRGMRNHVLSRIYWSGAYHAFTQIKTLDGQKLIREAIRADRSILEDQARIFLEQLILICLTCEDDIESHIDLVFSQLPSELLWITQYRQKVIANIYLLHGIADVLYGRENQAELKFNKSAAYGLQLEWQFMRKILTHVADYGETFGPHAAQKAINTIGKNLKLIGKRNEASWLMGTFFINRAFINYQQ
ncbi:hypothetical protein KA005_15895, partial [bacterium]|nr:hypothetical protein [bacterium]